MRIFQTTFLFLCCTLAHAAHLAPWNLDGDVARVGMVADGSGVAVRRVSSGGTAHTFAYDAYGSWIMEAYNQAMRTSVDGVNMILKRIRHNKRK